MITPVSDNPYIVLDWWVKDFRLLVTHPEKIVEKYAFSTRIKYINKHI